MRTHDMVCSLLAVAATATLGSHASAQPEPGARLLYTSTQVLLDGAGAYAGYAERTVARGRYEITSVSDTTATVVAEYRWIYETPDRREPGSERRTVEIDLATRRYLSSPTDLDDYDDQDGSNLAFWMWIPTRVGLGDALRILDQTFYVADLDRSVTAAGALRRAIVVSADYTGTRSDAYGTFTTQTRDEYWFDRETGMFLREHVVERNTGTLDGDFASFTLETTIELLDATWARSPTPVDESLEVTLPPRERRGGGGATEWYEDEQRISFIAAVVIGLATIPMLLWIAARQRVALRRTLPSGVTFDVKAAKAFEGMPPGVSAHFAPFVPHLVRVALAAREKVYVARASGSGELVGLGVGDGETRTATIFAPETIVCEALRRELDCLELFSEVRHPTLEDAVGITVEKHAYNLYETFDQMLCTERPAELGYDPELVGAIREGEARAVVELHRAAYGVPGERWLAAARAEGDLTWCAREDGKVIGFAMATVVGTSARLHALTVHPDARGRGVGTALMRARLRALFELGATTVLTEVATWNLAAMEIARAHGFQKVGEMFVESARASKDERRFVRR